ncbi:hypothetical protein, conserved [Trypanosoma brucei gambiense DAL972]|uniref:Uncharacterized protein n=3 Tax=Trypanosoma brucei TaxID=5691 RepID=C9ZJH7_TRYB9|nr:hypothetical protein, conserved [Trypanosoma brucei gambiense DAL972]RHW74160.1 hypothetical protein DPX39_020019800 [Trypanosoma brucei equiperdum]CBH09536.1 hypothetical protein, conserved [Trypanosoma brucei gambiense DAL972]|eukprot:XP_011771841.1 hypothetical protein, conserved [Trypanosoma brucei gambiense DAL972]
MSITVDTMSAQPLGPYRQLHNFTSTGELRRAVMSKEDEYSKFEREIVVEVNELRRDPARYADILREEATVGYPYVRADPKTQCCPEMTLEQLKVYIQDFKQEHNALEESIASLKKDWNDAQLDMRERWNHEDAERAKKLRRANIRKRRGSSLIDDDYLDRRQRAIMRMSEEFKSQIKEAEERKRYVERSCMWATEGATLILNCAQWLMQAESVPLLEYSRSLTLAARDVSNGHQSVLGVVAAAERPHGSPPKKGMRRVRASTESTVKGSQVPTSTTCALSELSEHTNSMAKLSAGLSGEGSSDSYKGSSECGTDGDSDDMERRQGHFNSGRNSYPSLSLSQTGAQRMDQSLLALAEESESLKQTTVSVYGKYGHLSGALRGIQMCNAFTPRKMVLQMLLAQRLPEFLLLAPNVNAEAYEFPAGSIRNPLLWKDGRLLGCGWVRAPDGRVSLTLLLATNFEELSLIHEQRDFSLPQIHRIINSNNNNQNGDDSPQSQSRKKELLSGRVVVQLQSSLFVEVVEPTSHPIFADRNQHVVRVVVRACMCDVDISATATSTLDPVPMVPLLDKELILVQRRLDDLNEVEILLDVRSARMRWSSQPLLVHIFERPRGLGAVEPFRNVGCIRVTPTNQCSLVQPEQNYGSLVRYQQHHHCHQPGLHQVPTDGPVVRLPSALLQLRCACPIDQTEEPCGWPLIMNEFQQRGATLIEPLCGVWTTLNHTQRVAVRVPRNDHLRCAVDTISTHLYREERAMHQEQRESSQSQLKEQIRRAKEELAEAQEEEKEGIEILQQEIAALQKNMVRRRGKELANLKRQEDALQQKVNELRDRVSERQDAVSDAEEELVLVCRRSAARSRRLKMLRREYSRLRDLTDSSKYPRVEVALIADGYSTFVSSDVTRLDVVDDACTVFVGEVPLVRGFCGRAVLLVDGLEAVQWDVRPGR